MSTTFLQTAIKNPKTSAGGVAGFLGAISAVAYMYSTGHVDNDALVKYAGVILAGFVWLWQGLTAKDATTHSTMAEVGAATQAAREAAPPPPLARVS